MSTTYLYTGHTTTIQEDLVTLGDSINASDISSAKYEGAWWVETDGSLSTVFSNDLSAGDKTILDGLVVGV